MVIISIDDVNSCFFHLKCYFIVFLQAKSVFEFAKQTIDYRIIKNALLDIFYDMNYIKKLPVLKKMERKTNFLSL